MLLLPLQAWQSKATVEWRLGEEDRGAYLISSSILSGGSSCPYEAPAALVMLSFISVPPAETAFLQQHYKQRECRRIAPSRKIKKLGSGMRYPARAELGLAICGKVGDFSCVVTCSREEDSFWKCWADRQEKWETDPYHCSLLSWGWLLFQDPSSPCARVLA